MIDPRLYPVPQPFGESVSLSDTATVKLTRGVTEILFTADAAKTVTLAGNVLPGMLVTLRRTHAGTTHDVKLALPTGYTFDGTNTVATPAKGVNKYITVICINEKRFAIIATEGTMTLGTS